MARHALKVLNQLREYDSFLNSLHTIVDMGCGTGEDITWWATLETRDDPPVPYNYKCFAIDQDATKLAQIPSLTNIHSFNRTFDEMCIPIQVDLIWAHDSLQYSINPINTLKLWNAQMNVNGMLILSIPQHSGITDDTYYSRTHSGCYYNFTVTNLIYMLAVNGFDCNDAYVLKEFNDPWIHIAVYKSTVDPMDPATTSWSDLIKLNLLNPSVVKSIEQHGYLRQEDIEYPWLDKQTHRIECVNQIVDNPSEVTNTYDGIIRIVKSTVVPIIKQGNMVKKETGVILQEKTTL
jgi:hypothetical protein